MVRRVPRLRGTLSDKGPQRTTYCCQSVGGTHQVITLASPINKSHQHPFIVNRSGDPSVILKDVIEEANRIIKEKGSREAALGEEPTKSESSSSRSSRSNSFKSNGSGSDSGSEREVDYGTMVINDEDGSDGDYDTGTMKSKLLQINYKLTIINNNKFNNNFSVTAASQSNSL